MLVYFLWLGKHYARVLEVQGLQCRYITFEYIKDANELAK